MTTQIGQPTPEQIERIKSAVADCDRYIVKESSRSADLRPTIYEPEVALFATMQHIRA